MASKLLRQTLTQFGSLVNGASEVGVYGSGATGSPVYTASITKIQSLAAWGRGWAAETIANNRPFLEDMNAVDCVFGYQLCYLFQEGVPEYDSTGNTFYFLNSIAQYGGTLYQVINDNGGNGISATAPGSATYWQTLQVSAQLGAWQSKSFGTVYQAATDGTAVAWATDSASSVELIGYTDSNSSPSTQRVGGYQLLAAEDYPTSVTMPVRKGDYWEITSTGNAGSVYFIGSGS